VSFSTLNALKTVCQLGHHTCTSWGAHGTPQTLWLDLGEERQSKERKETQREGREMEGGREGREGGTRFHIGSSFSPISNPGDEALAHFKVYVVIYHGITCNRLFE